MKLRSSFAKILSSAGPTIRRFWAPVALTVALTATLIVSTTGQHGPSDNQMRLASALASGILAAWCAILLWERESREQLLPLDSQLAGNLVALVAAASISGFAYLMLGEFTLVSMTRYGAICLFLALAFFVIPHIRKEGSLEMYTVRLFSQAVVSLLFSAVMFIGLSAITFTVSSLFSLDISFQVYVRIWLVMVGVLAPFLFMAGIPVGTVPADAEDYPKVLRNLVLYVVTPLITSYTLVLYLYFAKILITRQWPVGLVSHLVLWYSLVSTALLFFVWPLGSTNKWGESFTRYFPIAAIPLLLMMFASVGIRIHYYGITENRYYVLVLGLWVLGSMLYLNLRKTKKSVGLPVALALVVALSVVGPWSSFAVSKWSQNRRLESLLSKYDMLRDDAIVPAVQAIPLEDRREVAEILFYFDRNHDLSDVRLLPAGFRMDRFTTVFGFDYVDDAHANPRQYWEYVAENKGLDIGGYRYMFDYTGNKYYGTRYDDESAVSGDNGSVEVTYDRESHKVAVTVDGKLEWEKSLAEYIVSLRPEGSPDGETPLRTEDMTLTADTANARVRLVIIGVWGDTDSLSGEVNVNQIWFYLLAARK